MKSGEVCCLLSLVGKLRGKGLVLTIRLENALRDRRGQAPMRRCPPGGQYGRNAGVHNRKSANHYYPHAPHFRPCESRVYKQDKLSTDRSDNPMYQVTM